MKLNEQQEKILTQFGAILAGLQVPMSIGGPNMLGAAYEPTMQIRTDLCLMGYMKDEEIADKLRQVFTT